MFSLTKLILLAKKPSSSFVLEEGFFIFSNIYLLTSIIA